MARARILAERGDTLTRVIEWDDSGGAAVNLTGYTITATVTVGDVTLNLGEGSGLTVVDATGVITMVLSAAQTATFEEQFGTWELKATSGAGVVTTLAEGLFFVSF